MERETPSVGCRDMRPERSTPFCSRYFGSAAAWPVHSTKE
ncbi:hypothetical protein FTUN_0350 [Frigoriglobus tundricola]|uniref:Uncharacterized protein n=1 Tax=Frigoriglobus tundricola TaxID=2774151 RepID=A0A6M5YHW6_9BACT|nr:hypothetical protein FTUN_0350 [Frigoriglobus tundricola]